MENNESVLNTRPHLPEDINLPHISVKFVEKPAKVKDLNLLPNYILPMGSLVDGSASRQYMRVVLLKDESEMASDALSIIANKVRENAMMFYENTYDVDFGRTGIHHSRTKANLEELMAAFINTFENAVKYGIGMPGRNLKNSWSLNGSGHAEGFSLSLYMGHYLKLEAQPVKRSLHVYYKDGRTADGTCTLFDEPHHFRLSTICVDPGNGLGSVDVLEWVDEDTLAQLIKDNVAAMSKVIGHEKSIMTDLVLGAVMPTK